jgi:hypothetical protein
MAHAAKNDLDQLSPELRRKLSRLHKWMDAAEAAGGVQPPRILNRRTGKWHEFGPRRAYDGTWMIEMLGASGCTTEQVDAAIFVLEPLIEWSIKIDKDLLKLLTFFYEPVPEQKLRQLQRDLNRSQLHIVK